MSDEREPLTVDEALAMLPDPEAESVHTFLDAGVALIGADWGRETVLKCWQAHGVEFAGPQATKRGHGLVSVRSDGPPVFFETKKEDFKTKKEEL